jgi:hypothetical protein
MATPRATFWGLGEQQPAPVDARLYQGAGYPRDREEDAPDDVIDATVHVWLRRARARRGVAKLA